MLAEIFRIAILGGGWASDGNSRVLYKCLQRLDASRCTDALALTFAPLSSFQENEIGELFRFLDGHPFLHFDGSAAHAASLPPAAPPERAFAATTPEEALHFIRERETHILQEMDTTYARALDAKLAEESPRTVAAEDAVAAMLLQKEMVAEAKKTRKKERKARNQDAVLAQEDWTNVKGTVGEIWKDLSRLPRAAQFTVDKLQGNYIDIKTEFNEADF
ncbi:MAG TPA: hypothetical protein EYP98_08550, partial [Planctomycetes bacterium]|nr:hypothetical protein [Planctomycetota bacterium]